MPVRKAPSLHGIVAGGVFMLASVVASGCAQVGSAYYGITGSPMNCAEARDYTATGTASWYGKTHQGHRTASGAPFDMNGMTAAHRTLPFGTKIRVTNTKNGRSVVLTINDRGPFIKGRLLDVSYRAAQELQFVRAGLTTARIDVIEPC
jgi:rare lipoprotein A